MALTKEQIFATKGRLKTEAVKVPEWATDGDDEVLIRELTGEELDAYQASLSMRRPALVGPNKGQMEFVPDLANAKAKLVARCIVDEQGERQFTDADIIQLGRLSGAALSRVYDAAAKLSGLTDEAAGEIEGNSEAAPSGSSISESPATTE